LRGRRVENTVARDNAANPKLEATPRIPRFLRSGWGYRGKLRRDVSRIAKRHLSIPKSPRQSDTLLSKN